MTNHTRDCALIIPAALRDDIQVISIELNAGYNFTVPLADAEDTDTITHYGSCGVCTDTFAAILSFGLVSEELTPERLAAVNAALISSTPERVGLNSHSATFDALCVDHGLVRYSSEEQP